MRSLTHEPSPYTAPGSPLPSWQPVRPVKLRHVNPPFGSFAQNPDGIC